MIYLKLAINFDQYFDGFTVFLVNLKPIICEHNSYIITSEAVINSKT